MATTSPYDIYKKNRDVKSLYFASPYGPDGSTKERVSGGIQKTVFEVLGKITLATKLELLAKVTFF